MLGLWGVWKKYFEFSKRYFFLIILKIHLHSSCVGVCCISLESLFPLVEFCGILSESLLSWVGFLFYCRCFYGPTGFHGLFTESRDFTAKVLQKHGISRHKSCKNTAFHGTSKSDEKRYPFRSILLTLELYGPQSCISSSAMKLPAKLPVSRRASTIGAGAVQTSKRVYKVVIGL